MGKLHVVSPEGWPADTPRRAAARLPDLSGRVIGEAWNGVFKGDRTFPLLRAALLRRHPGLRIVPYTEFPHQPVGDEPARQREHARRVARLASERGCEALITGNGA